MTAELFLYLAQDIGGEEGPDIDKFMRKGVPRRGQDMKVEVQPLAPGADKSADANIVGADSNYIGAVKDMLFKVSMSKKLCNRKGFERIFCTRHSCRNVDEFLFIIRAHY